jgi:hypothetical protein
LSVARNGRCCCVFASKRWAQWIRGKKDDAMLCANGGYQLQAHCKLTKCLTVCGNIVKVL